MSTTVDNLNKLNEDEKPSYLSRILYPIKDGLPQVPWLAAFLGASFGALVFGVYRWYQHEYSFTVGLDYFEPEFQTYWMNLFWAQMTIITLIGVIGVPWLWFTRPKEVEMSPVKELGVYYVIFSFMAVASLLVVVILALYAEADAACEAIYKSLAALGLEALYDDRSERAGAKFATMDLIGLPWRITVGPRGLKNGVVELTCRKTGESEELAPEAAVAKVVEIYKAL